MYFIGNSQEKMAKPGYLPHPMRFSPTSRPGKRQIDNALQISVQFAQTPFQKAALRLLLAQR
jgi:hypothetical protein